MYEPKVYFPLTYNIGTQKPIFHHVLNFSVFQPFQPILVSQKKKKKRKTYFGLVFRFWENYIVMVALSLS